MAPLIVFDSGRPVLAISTIGASLVQESDKVILESLTEGADLVAVLSSPPLLLASSQPQPSGIPMQILQVPAGAYNPTLIAQLRAQGITVKECTAVEVLALRGTPAVARFDGSARVTAEVPGVFNFAMGY
jgi:hypothetical protein